MKKGGRRKTTTLPQVVLPLIEQWSRSEKIRTAVREVINPDLKDEHLYLFFHECQRRGVHPLDRMIHPVVREGRLTIQAGIDYLRSLAEKSGEYFGQDPPVFVWDEKNPGRPLEATVTVYRRIRDEKVKFIATARYRSYVALKKDGSPTFLWVKAPDVMLSKCAEALALRKAFPVQLGGLYAEEELQGTLPSKSYLKNGNEKGDKIPLLEPARVALITPEQNEHFRKTVTQVARRNGVPPAEVVEHVKAILKKDGIEKLADMPQEKYEHYIIELEGFSSKETEHAQR